MADSDFKKMVQRALDRRGAMPVGDIFTPQGADLATNRILRIRENWEYYLGQHRMFSVSSEDDPARVIYNYVRAITNKSIRWLTNPGWTIRSYSGNEAYEEFLNTIWIRNNRDFLFRHLAGLGAIAGDSFCWVGVKGDLEKDRKNARLRLKYLQSENSHPVFETGDPSRLLYFIYQEPINLRGTPYESRKGIPDPASAFPLAVRTQIYTDEKYEIYINDAKVEEGDNPYGFINIVHIPNIVMPGAAFGQDEANHLKQSNQSVNEIVNNMKDIVDYYSAPMTIGYGISLKDLESGAGNFLGNAPKDARVESIPHQADLNASVQVASSLVEAMHDQGNIPLGSLTSQQTITNTTEAALRVYFMPLMEIIEEKQSTYGQGIGQINKMIVQICEETLEIEVSKLAQHENPALRLETFTQFQSPIPRDKSEFLQSLDQRLRMRILSRAEALREYSAENNREHAAEILMDIASDLFADAQRGNAALGIPVSYAGLAAGSLGKSSGDKKTLAEITRPLQDVEALEAILSQNLRKEISNPTSQPDPAQITNDILEAVKTSLPNLDEAGKSAVITAIRNRLESR